MKVDDHWFDKSCCKITKVRNFNDFIVCNNIRKVDDRNEASEYDEHDGGVYKELVGHAPIELSSL